MAQLVPIVKQTFQEFQRHKSQWLAAAIAYFTVFAIAPLIIVVVEIAGAVLGHHRAVLNEIYGYLRSSAGPGAASAIQTMVSATFDQKHAGTIAQFVSWASLYSPPWVYLRRCS